MSAFLYRFLGSPIGLHPVCAEGPFPDVPATNPFCGEITYLKLAGVVSGYNDGGFHPTANVARQAIAAFLHRVATP